MKKTMIAVAFAVASVPMMFAAQTPAQTPANPPAAGTKVEAPKTNKHVKKTSKKVAPKKDTGSTAPAPVSK